jgi:Flp pilus assembly protein TadG
MTSMRSRHTRARSRIDERGLASFEFVLSLPILLVMTLLAFNVARQARVRLEVINATREGAYRSAYGLSSALDLLQIPMTSAGQPIAVTTSAVTQPTPSNLLQQLRAGQSDADARTSILNGQQDGVQQSAGFAFFFGSRTLPLWDFVVKDSYTTIAAAAWERTDFPIGYDRYLDGDVSLDSWMPDAFPRGH